MSRRAITSLEENDLSEDILLRLAKQRLFTVDSWQIVRSLFSATAVDPRLTKSSWIAEMLLDLVPAEGYPAVRGGFLDADTAWPLLLRHAIGLASETPDLTSLLKWSLDGEATARFRLAASTFQQSASRWLAEKAGPVAETVLGCVARMGRPDAVPLAQAIKHVLAVDEDCRQWSRRATARLADIRQEFAWLDEASSAVVSAGGGGAEWWTFGGSRTNATLARQLAQELGSGVKHDSFALTFDSSVQLQDAEQAIAHIRNKDVAAMRPAVEEAAVDGLKFSECLPIELAREMLEQRLQDPVATSRILHQRVRFLTL